MPATATANTSTDGNRSQITLLFEKHTRLLAGVVAGKLDVFEVANNLPDTGDADETVTLAETKS